MSEILYRQHQTQEKVEFALRGLLESQFEGQPWEVRSELDKVYKVEWHCCEDGEVVITTIWS